MLFYKIASVNYKYFLVETDNYGLSIVDGEANVLEAIKFKDIVKMYKKKIEDLLSEKKNRENQSREIKQKKESKEENHLILVSNKKLIDSLEISERGNFCYTKDNNFFETNYNIKEALTKSLSIDSVLISTNKMIFTHVAHFINRDVRIPIIALEICFTDTTSNYSRLKSLYHVNYGLERVEISPKFIEKTFLKNETEKVYKAPIRSISTLVFEGNHYVLRKGYYSKYSYKLPEYDIDFKFFNYFIALFIIFLIYFLRKIFLLFKVRKYNQQKLVKQTEEYQIFTAKVDQRTIFIKRYKRKNKTVLVELEALHNSCNEIINFFFQKVALKTFDIAYSYHKTDLATFLKNNKYSHDILCKIKNAVFEIHDRGISHNNLSLVSIFVENGKIIISDFNYAIFENKPILNKITLSKPEIGEKMWRSPELILRDKELDFEAAKSSDLFSLTLILYYCYYKDYPYDIKLTKNISEITRKVEKILKNGDPEQINIYENNIKSNKLFLRNKKNIPFHDLVSNQLNDDVESRYKGFRYKNHIFFWDNKKIFDFLATASDILENRCELSKKVYSTVEKNKFKVFRKNWSESLDLDIIFDLSKKKIYKYDSLKNLLRAIRNLGRHYKELSAESKLQLHSYPDGLVNYFLKKFPYLLTTVFYSFIPTKRDESIRDFYYNMF